MSTLNSGPFQGNRFAAMDELYHREREYYTRQLAEKKKAKPDFLDVDGDGDKKESFKKGVKDKEKDGDKKEGKKDLPAFLQKKEVKEAKCGDGCDCDDCKKAKKKGMNEWIEELVTNGHDLSMYNMEQMEEMYDKVISEMSGQEEVTIEEAVMQYLMDNGFANNLVSAEVVFANMSEGWRDSVVNEIEEGFKPLPTDKMARQAGKAYGKEQAAAKAGNEKEANKQMQRGIAMKDPAGRKAAMFKR